jgi:fibronectin type III domain protein
MKRVCLFVSAGMIVLAIGCSGRSAPTSPSPAPVQSLPGLHALAVPTPGVGANTVTWNAFTASRADGSIPRLVSAAVSTAGAPSNLTSAVTGSTVVLTWSAPGAGDAAASYVVEAGSSSGGSNVANFDTGTTATSLTALGVASGTYYIRVRAKNAAGVGAASNEIVVTVGAASPCATAPAPPTGLTSAVAGSAVTLTWIAPAGGCPPTNYVLEAGSSPAGVNLANFSTGSTATSFSTGGVGAGTYYVRVRATNAGGVSGASNEVVLLVGSTQPSADLTGRWVGLSPDGLVISDTSSCDAEQDVQLDITQSGPTLSGTVTSRTRRLWNPCGVIGFIATVQLSGTAGAGTISFTVPAERGRFITFSGTYTANRMTLTAGSGAVLTANRQ